MSLERSYREVFFLHRFSFGTLSIRQKCQRYTVGLGLYTLQFATEMSEKPLGTSTNVENDVIVVGGGPVGLFLGLTLAQKGVKVLVLEAEADIVPSPRALM